MARLLRIEFDWVASRPKFFGATSLFFMVGSFHMSAFAADQVRDAFTSRFSPKLSWKATWASHGAEQQSGLVDREIRRTSAGADASGAGLQESNAGNVAEKEPLKADAGDDVLSFVGHRATLNGGQSVPAGQVGVRWIQIAGPLVKEAYLQGPNLVVVPPEPGVYQFLLVVAQGNQISEPDHVTLTAVEIPAELKAREPQATAPTAAPAAAALEKSRDVVAEVPVSNEELMARLAHQTVANLPRSAEMAPPLALLFSDVAGKMPLYASYAEANEELARRIGQLFTDTQADSQAWTTQVFEPLTAALALWARPSGLDLRDRSQWQLPMTPIQRATIGDGLMAFARGLRGDLKSAVNAEKSRDGAMLKAARGVNTETRK